MTILLSLVNIDFWEGGYFIIVSRFGFTNYVIMHKFICIYILFVVDGCRLWRPQEGVFQISFAGHQGEIF